VAVTEEDSKERHFMIAIKFAARVDIAALAEFIRRATCQ
jgi:hypothetical protein